MQIYLNKHEEEEKSIIEQQLKNGVSVAILARLRRKTESEMTAYLEALGIELSKEEELKEEIKLEDVPTKPKEETPQVTEEVKTETIPEISEEKQEKKVSRFKPGQSGNPKGKPKGTISLLSILKKELQKKPKNEQKTYAEKIIEILIRKAVEDEDINSIREIFNRMEGMPKSSVTTPTGEPFILKITNYGEPN